MASKTSTCLLACVILFFIQNSTAKSLIPKCGYACTDDLDTIEASGSAISSQYLAPDGSVITHSKETSYSSDGIKQTFHQLKKEADQFVQTGHSNLAIPPHPVFSDFISKIPMAPPAVPYAPYNAPSHDSFLQSTKDHSQIDNFQAQSNLHSHSNSEPCNICSIQSGTSSGKSDASYNAIVGNTPISSGSSYSNSRYESASHQKNSSQQSQPILFVNSPKANTFTTNLIDINTNSNQNGQGSETHIDYKETGHGQIKTEEHVGYGLGPVSSPSRVVVQVSGSGPAAQHSSSYEKKEASSHVEQTSGIAVAPPVHEFVQQAEVELAKQQQQQQNQVNGLYSPVIYRGVPQSIPLEGQQSGGSHSSSYYSSSSSHSKTVSSSGSSPPVVVQPPPQKYISSSNSGYSSSGSISSGSHSQNPPEFYYNGNKVHGASSSIYDHSRGDTNAETLCTTNCQPCVTCTYVAPSAPVKNTYGVSTSYSSQSSTINGKTTENREAAVAVNDNGKVDHYYAKSPPVH